MPEHFLKASKRDKKTYETALVGEMVMMYEYHNRKEESYSGSAILYTKITDFLYVIKTAAHNLVKFKVNDDGSSVSINDPSQMYTYPSSTYFYLQRKET